MNDRDTIKLNAVPIPKRFMLMGQVIEVEWDKALNHKDDSIGMAVYRENKILLQLGGELFPIPSEQTEQVFLHELIHWIFESLNRKDLKTDEVLVEQIANLVHQAFKTAEY